MVVANAYWRVATFEKGKTADEQGDGADACRYVPCARLGCVADGFPGVGKEVHLARVRKEFSVAGFINASVSALYVLSPRGSQAECSRLSSRSAKIPFKPISQQVSAVPALLPPRSDVQTQSSAVVPTPDSEIGQYSSQQRPVDAPGQEDHATPTKRYFADDKTTKSRPAAEPLVLGLDGTDSDSDDEDGLKAVLRLKAGVERTRDEERRRMVFEEKQRVLKARKEAAVKAQLEAERSGRQGATTQRNGKVDVKSSFLKGVSRARLDVSEIDVDGSDADDDLVILDKPAVKPAASKKTAPRPNPKDMLDVKRETGANGKPRKGGGVLHFAPRQEVTESMFQHAGQTFDQAGKRHREGYAGKADNAHGTGSHKLAPITNEQSLAYLLEQQRRLAALERQKKERESGLKSRALQPRREQLIDEAVLEETRKAEERMLTGGVDEEEEVGEANDDDDSEDGDFAPEPEGEEGEGEAEAEADVEMEDRVLVQETQPGEAAEREDTVMADEATPEGQDTESMPLTAAMDPEETEEALRQRKRKRVAVLDSDDEDGSPRFPTMPAGPTKRVEFDSEGVPESSLVSRKPSDLSDAPAMPSFGGGFDDFAGGFGESGGLSQFFGATQAPGATAAATQKTGLGKGLDVLRQGTPAAGHLAFGNLGAVVSATAQERNMALFGAELGSDPHTGYTPRPPKKQYLNSQG